MWYTNLFLAVVAVVLIASARFGFINNRKGSNEEIPYRSPWLCYGRFALVIIAAAILVVGNGRLQLKARDLGIPRTPRFLHVTQIQLRILSKCLRSYYNVTGCYPTNDEGLDAIRDMLAEHRSAAISRNQDEQGEEFDQYISLRTMRIDASVILSRWGDPFIYENRGGFPAEAFADSRVEMDKRHIYSIKVDGDIYIWSLAAREKHRVLSEWDLVCARTQSRVVGLSLVFFAAFMVASTRLAVTKPDWLGRIRSMLRSLIGAAALTLLVVGILLPGYVRTGDHTLTYPRTQELTRDYIRLMTKYRDCGVISEATFRRRVKSVRNPARTSW